MNQNMRRKRGRDEKKRNAIGVFGTPKRGFLPDTTTTAHQYGKGRGTFVT
jgi:hypothetical protein